MTGDKSQGREPPLIDARPLGGARHSEAVDPAFAGLDTSAGDLAGGDAPQPAAALAPAPRAGLAMAILGGAAVAALAAIALQMGGGGDVAALRQMAETRAKETAALEQRLKSVEARAQTLADALERSRSAATALEVHDKRLSALEGAPAPEPSGGKLAALEQRIVLAEQSAAAARTAAILAPAADASAPAAPVDLAPLAGRIDALEPRFAELAGGGKAQAAVLARIGAGLEGVAAQSAAADARAAALEARLDGAGRQFGAGLADVSGKLAALDGRVGPLEAKLDAAKSDARATEARIEAVAATPGSAAVAVVAQSALLALAAGMPVASQTAALESLGVDPVRIAPLKAMGDKGVAPPAAAQFKSVATAIVASAQPPRESPPGVMDWLGGKASSLVKVKVEGEPAGETPADLAARIEGALARGDGAAALAAWDSLPAPAKAASLAWAQPVQAREAALKAARALLDEAIKGLGARKS